MRLKENQQAFIELTNPVHGGEGWEFGEALWSPTKSSNQADTWAAMREVKPGDIIIHSLKTKSVKHRFYGISQAKASHKIVEDEPLIPDKWAKSKGYEAYYKVPLTNYSALSVKPFVSEFLETYKQSLIGITGSFFVSTVDNPAQKYLVKLDNNVFNMIIDYLESVGNNIFEQVEVSDNDNNEDEVESIPGRTTVTTERIIRDTTLVKSLKEQYQNKCQICGLTITLPNGKEYSEGHHLKKLGSYHEGPDIRENIIILCPTHHVEFDYGIIAIEPGSHQIIHIDENNQFHRENLAYQRTDLGERFIKYHKKKIFNK